MPPACFASGQLKGYIIAGRKFHACGRRNAHQHGVVPSEPSNRLGQFLEPAVICVFAIADGRIGAEYNFKGSSVAAWTCVAA